MSDETKDRLIEAALVFFRILVFWAFTRFATMGYFTPEDATELRKHVMDLLVNGAPFIYASWAAKKVVKGPEK